MPNMVCCAALSELDQFDRMINWMLVTYFGCLGLGWGLLLFDWVWNKTHKLHSQVAVVTTAQKSGTPASTGLSMAPLDRYNALQEPWVNDAVVIGGASAVLSPIIQWGHTILQSRPQVCLMTSTS